MRVVLSLVLCLGLVLLAQGELSEPRCPTVFDGPAQGSADLSIQTSQSVIGAHWFGLGVDEVLGYEWAVISSQLYATPMKEACATELPFVGQPDVTDWRFVRKDTQVFITDAELSVEATYYVIVRTTLQSGKQIYSVSNGVRVVPHAEVEAVLAHDKRAVRETSQAREKRAHLLNPLGVCPIENANRCRQSETNVGDFLRQKYGPPEFNRFSQARTLFRFPTTGDDAVNAGLGVNRARENGGDGTDDDDDDASDDDDDGIGGGAIAGIILAVLIAVLIFMILVALLAMALAGGRERPYKPRPASAAPAAAPAPAAAAADPGDNETRLEFPDIDPHSRLSTA